MRMRVGCINAHCESCRGEDFQPLAEIPGAQELVCFGCGARTSRRALLMQIADETVRRAQAFLESSRKQRQRSPR